MTYALAQSSRTVTEVPRPGATLPVLHLESELGLPDKALTWYEEAAEEGGEVAVLAYVGIGNVKAEFGDPEEARKAYEKALKLTKEERLKARIKELMELVEGKAAE